MPTCLDCLWFSGDPETQFGWCYCEGSPTQIDHHCDFWEKPKRFNAETGEGWASLKDLEEEKQ